MRWNRPLRYLQFLAYGAIMLQAGGCALEVINQYVQTILLGVTAAGAIAILRNV
jgi:hypothetical protein